MSSYVSFDIYLPIARLEEALNATWELGRLPRRKLNLEHELTLPSGSTLKTPFGSAWNEPPYVLKAGEDSVTLDITAWCPAPDWVDESYEFERHSIRGQAHLLLPLDLSIQAGQEFARLSFSSDGTCGGMILDDAVLRRLGSVAKVGQAVASAVSVDGHQSLLDANFGGAGSIDLDRQACLKPDDSGEVDLDRWVAALVQWLKEPAESEERRPAPSDADNLPAEATVARLDPSQSFSHGDCDDASHVRYEMWRAVLNGGAASPDIRQLLTERDPLLADEIYTTMQQLAIKLLPYDDRKNPANEQFVEASKRVIASLGGAPPLPLPPSADLAGALAVPPDIPHATQSGADEVFLAFAADSIKQSWDKSAALQAAGDWLAARMVLISGLQAALAQLAYCSECDEVQRTTAACRRAESDIGRPLAEFWRHVLKTACEAEDVLLAADAWWLLEGYCPGLVEEADRKLFSHVRYHAGERLEQVIHSARRKSDHFQMAARALAWVGRLEAIENRTKDQRRAPPRAAQSKPRTVWSMDAPGGQPFVQERLADLEGLPFVPSVCTIFNASTPFAFFQGGRRIIAVDGSEKRLAIFDTADGNLLTSFPFDRDPSFNRLAISPDERWLAGISGTPYIWDLNEPSKPQALPAWAQHAHFSADSRYFFAADRSEYYPSKVWSCGEWGEGRELASRGIEIWAAACSPTDPWIAIQSRNAETIIYALADGRRLATFGHGVPAEESPAGGLVFSPSGEWLVAKTTNTAVEIWNLRDGKLHCVLEPFAGHLGVFGFTSDSQQLVLTSSHGHGVWSVADGKCLHMIRRPARSDRASWKYAIKMFRTLFGQSSDEEKNREYQQVAELTEQFMDENLPGEDEPEVADAIEGSAGGAWSPERELLIVRCTSDDKEFTAVRTKDGRLAALIPVEGELHCLAFSQDGSLLAAEVEAQRIEIWDTSQLAGAT